MARKKVSTKIYFMRSGTNYFVPLSIALLLKQKPKLDQAVQKVPQAGGFNLVAHEAPGNYEPMWELTLTEETGPALALLTLAAPSGQVNQAAIAIADYVLVPAGWGTGIVAQTYFVGFPNITWTSLKVNGVAWVRGTDYLVDEGTGMLTFLTTGTAAYTYDIVARFVVNQQYVLSFKMLDTAWVRGEVRMVQSCVEYPEASEVNCFVGELKVTDQGTLEPTKFREYKLELLAIDAPTTQTL